MDMELEEIMMIFHIFPHRKQIHMAYIMLGLQKQTDLWQIWLIKF